MESRASPGGPTPSSGSERDTTWVSANGDKMMYSVNVVHKINISKLHLRQSIQMAYTSKNLKKAMQNIFKGK